MDNFSKVYVTDYSYKWKEVPWELRNLTATGVFILPKSQTLLLNYTNISLNSPLPINTHTIWKIFWKFFFFKVQKAKNFTYSSSKWIETYIPSKFAVDLHLHTTFKPLELLEYNPSTIQGTLSTLYYLKTK